MNFKDLLLPLALALVATWGVQYFFFSGPRAEEAKVATDRRFVAPTSVIVAEPLDFEIDFSDAQPTRPREVTIVNLPYGIIHLVNDGAVIDFMAFKRMLDGKESLIETITPAASREKGAFLVALSGLGSTPYYYTLKEKKEEPGLTRVIYTGESAQAVVTKEFVLHHTTYAIDLRVTVEPKAAESVRPRLFFPAPVIVDPAAGTTQAVLFEGNSLLKKPVKDLEHVGIELPTIFGLQDHYFLHSLIKDPQQFAQRAYFKVGEEQPQAVLQSAPVTAKTTWETTFYVGPKEMKALAAVDTRLEGVLDYGWFAPLSKLLLYLLNFFFGLLHNYGLAIIAVTLLVRLIMVPFTLHGEQSRKKHAEAQKKLQYIEQKYKHDPELLAREKAEFAKKHGVSGVLGCLPLLLQIPVFIGLQRVLTNAIELYQAPFLWIPNLAAADPYYILPAFVGVGMAFQMAQAGDPRQRVANVILAIIVAAVTANLSAGLTLFISVSTLLGLLQSYIQKVFKYD